MKRIDQDMLDTLSAQAAAVARRRLNLNLHTGPADPVQRFCNALEPGTYVRPHRHGDPAKWELFVVLQGALVLLTFDPTGRVSAREELQAGGPLLGTEIPAGTWHTLAALQPGTVMLEIKQGPYEPLTDKDFAPWAPAEGEAGAARFEAWFRSAQPGATPPQASSG